VKAPKPLTRAEKKILGASLAKARAFKKYYAEQAAEKSSRSRGKSKR